MKSKLGPGDSCWHIETIEVEDETVVTVSTEDDSESVYIGSRCDQGIIMPGQTCYFTETVDLSPGTYNITVKSEDDSHTVTI